MLLEVEGKCQEIWSLKKAIVDCMYICKWTMYYKYFWKMKFDTEKLPVRAVT